MDSTILLAKLGDQAWLAVLRRHNALIVDATAAQSGTLVETQGRRIDADHFFGTTVHYAARVASDVLGGEVLVSNLVRELVAGPGIEFLGSRGVEPKGIEGSHRLFAVDLG